MMEIIIGPISNERHTIPERKDGCKTKKLGERRWRTFRAYEVHTPCILSVKFEHIRLFSHGSTKVGLGLFDGFHTLHGWWDAEWENVEISFRNVAGLGGPRILEGVVIERVHCQDRRSYRRMRCLKVWSLPAWAGMQAV